MSLILDGSIILLYFVVIAAVGLRMGRREESLSDFALGGRRIPWWAVMASIIAAETSAATFLGAPGEGYESRSLVYVQLVAGVILGRIIVGAAFLKPYYTYRVYTVYDYLGVRFGPRTRGYVSALFLVMRTLASGTRLFVPALVMVLAWRLFTGGATGPLTVTTVTPYVVAVIALTVATLIYTAAGGIKAVIWTDVIQATLMFGSALLAVGVLVHQVGGLHAVAQAVPQMRRPEGYVLSGFEPDSIASWKASHHLVSMGIWDYVMLVLGSQYTVFSALIATTVTNMAAFGTDQDMVQRLLTAETYRSSRRSLVTAAVTDLPIASAFTFIGILLYVFYLRRPDLRPAATADVFAAYILRVLPAGVRGLVLAGVFATAMGSFSAALNALATSATNDWYIPRAPGRDPKHYVSAARWFTALFALLMVLVAAWFAYQKVAHPETRIIPVVLSVAGYIQGPMLGVFALGMFTRRRGSDTGNIAAVTGGLIATIAAGRFGVAFTWYALVGAVAPFALGALFRTPAPRLAEAKRQAEAAQIGADVPLALRER